MKAKLQNLFLSIISFLIFNFSFSCSAQSIDTVRVMVYNTLGFGSPGLTNCQAVTNISMPPLYTGLKEIVQFANPDIIGLDKMQCISGQNGFSPLSFPDTVVSESLDAAYPGRYAWCPFTALSMCHEGFSSVLFYDQNKFTYVSTTPLTWEQEDIDMFKLYYNTYLNNGSDTTYLYVILCHTLDASLSDTGSDEADSAVMNKVRTLFTHTPNLIYMGDFNTHMSTAAGYEYITQTSDTNYIMNDPPFHPDAHLTYPDIWHTGNAAQAYFTTTTRETTEPNSCGTTGGAKDWYDHILLSPWLINGIDNLTYVRNSYKTIGNNGNRAGISVNDSTTAGINTSVPDDVRNALFNFSDKYPVEVTLAVNPVLAVMNIQSQPGSIKINNPVEDALIIHFDSFLNGQNVIMDVYDVCGRNLYQSSFNVNSSVINKNISLVPGVYFIHFTAGGYSATLKVVKE